MAYSPITSWQIDGKIMETVADFILGGSKKRWVLGVHWKDWCWSWNSNTLATSFEELIHWERPWCWEGLGAGGEGDDKGWDGWMASLTQWTWVWVNSGNWWWTGRPGVLRFMRLQRVGHDWATELSWTELKITAGGDYSHEIKGHLLFGRKIMTNLDSILKSRDIILPIKIHLVKAMVFPLVMYGCESWTIKKAECQRIDASELWCWRRLLRVPWTEEDPTSQS